MNERPRSPAAAGTQLKFGKLGVATKTYYIQKTGFPFYDACQLVGAMHLFFGTGASSLYDKNAYWELSGPVLGANVANYGERLKGRNLNQVDRTLKHLKDLEDEDARRATEEFFQAPPPKTEVLKKTTRKDVSHFLEPTLQQGARGSDAALYGRLASGRGRPSKRPVPELLVATLGLTQVALASGTDEVTTVLPVLENSLQPLTPFIIFRQRYQHGAGGAISAVFASLGILVDLGQKYRIQDFAFAYHRGRGFYYSGLLGLHKLCSSFAGVEEFARQALNYLERTRSTDRGVPIDLARLLADFLKNSSLNTLAAIVRTKSRILTDKDIAPWVCSAASELLGTPKAIKEALAMAENSKHVPPPSEGLVKALGEVFRAENQGAWIGAYINLERAHKADEFYKEVGKILSRALSRSENNKNENNKKYLASKIRDAISQHTSQEVLDACAPENQRYFLAHKTTFLLRVLGSMKYQAPAEESKGEQE